MNNSTIDPEFFAQCVSSVRTPPSSSGELPCSQPDSPQSPATTFRLPLSDLEAKHYYHGLHSRPILVARTGTDTWTLPTGSEAHCPLKELRVVGNHPLCAIWPDHLAHQIYEVLGSKSVNWTSIDVIRIGVVGESVAPVVVWIGVKPGSLSGEDGLAAAKECKKPLVANDIHDVEVEIRESIRW